jgi:DNA-directed RNA polymerase specialized sigma24 family protein
MTEQGSVTVWLQLLKDGDHREAVAQLWATYFGRLVRLARDHLRARPRPVADEEDVALSAFDSFVRAAEAGRFPRLNSRDDLWQVLFVLTARKAVDLIEKETTQKAGGGRVVHISALGASDGGSGAEVTAQAAGPSPADVVAMAEGLERMLEVLGREDLRQVVVWRMEGYTNEEIAARLNRSVATVERKLQTVRAIYRDAGFCADPLTDFGTT